MAEMRTARGRALRRSSYRDFDVEARENLGSWGPLAVTGRAGKGARDVQKRLGPFCQKIIQILVQAEKCLDMSEGEDSVAVRQC